MKTVFTPSAELPRKSPIITDGQMAARRKLAARRSREWASRRRAWREALELLRQEDGLECPEERRARMAEIADLEERLRQCANM